MRTTMYGKDVIIMAVADCHDQTLAVGTKVAYLYDAKTA